MKMKDEVAELDSKIRGLDDQALLAVVTSPDEYRPEALAIAEAERMRRNLEMPSAESILEDKRGKDLARRIKRNQKKGWVAGALASIPM